MKKHCLFNRHKWNGCKCSVCGIVRNKEHTWIKDRCIVCGKWMNDWYIHHLSYPADRAEIIGIIDTYNSYLHRRDCMLKLPYPKEKEYILHMICCCNNNNLRADCIKRLSYPEDHDVLTRYVSSHSHVIRAACLRKMQYPEDKSLLVKKSLFDKDAECRRICINKLPYPDEKDALIAAALHDPNSDVRLAAIQKLPYPAEKETLIRVALNDDNADNRITALEAMDPKEPDIIDSLQDFFKEYVKCSGNCDRFVFVCSKLTQQSLTELLLESNDHWHYYIPFSSRYQTVGQHLIRLVDDIETLQFIIDHTKDVYVKTESTAYMPAMICREQGHIWQEKSEEVTDTYFPEGIDPCMENMCFLESTTYTKHYKVCSRCGLTGP